MSQDATRARGGVSRPNLRKGSAAAGIAAALAATPAVAAARSQPVRRSEIVPGAPPPKLGDGDLVLTNGRIVHDEGIVG